MQNVLDFATLNAEGLLFLIFLIMVGGLVVEGLAYLAIAIVRFALGKPDPNRQYGYQNRKKRSRSEDREVQCEGD